MRRLACLLILGVGCGRIAIDPLVSTDGAAADAATDAAPIPCAVEGSPCDDGNICTTSATCTAGICIGVGDMVCTVAHSRDEFSTTQGARGWSYGYWEISTDANASYQAATDFRELAQLSGAWRPPSYADQPDPNFTWAYLLHWGGHPGSYPEVRAPIRRWISDVNGRANAIVHMARADSGGDGTRMILVVDGVTLLSRDVAGAGGEVTETVPIDVTIGSTVDLLLHPIAEDGADSTTMWMNIDSR